MMGRTSGSTSSDPVVRGYLQEEARADRNATAKQLRFAVEQRLRQEGIQGHLPKDRAIQIIAKAARESPDHQARQDLRRWIVGKLLEADTQAPTWLFDDMEDLVEGARTLEAYITGNDK